MPHASTRGLRAGLLSGFAALFIIAGQPAAAQSPAPAKLPAPSASMEPVDLLKLLPPPPKDWNLTASRASNQLTSELGMKTFALREYHYTPPPEPNAAPGTPPPLPQETRVTLVDTGYDPTALSDFTQFKAGFTYPGEKNTRRYMLGNHPAILTSAGPDKFQLTINLAMRLNVLLEGKNQTEASLQKWVDLLNLAGLAQAAATAPHRPISPKNVRLTKVDELNSKANGSRTESYVTAAEEEAYEKMLLEQAQQQQKAKIQ